MLKKLILATSLLLPFAAKAEILFDNLVDPLPFEFSSLFDGKSGSFSVPEGSIWSVSSITLNIGQGSAADMFITITDQFSASRGVSSVTAIAPLLNFVATTFSFTEGVTLAPGTYDIVATYTITGIDGGSFWNSGPDMLYRVEGSSSPIPEPSSFAALAGVAMLAGALGRRRRA